MAATSMPVAPVRILVVDDFEPWRNSVRSTLKRHAEVRIVGEAADGVEAVQRAGELRPDLTLLDIGLPKMVQALLPHKFWAATRNLPKEHADRPLDEVIALAEVRDLGTLRQYDFVSLESNKPVTGSGGAKLM